jgi:hypothetical protein
MKVLSRSILIFFVFVLFIGYGYSDKDVMVSDKFTGAANSSRFGVRIHNNASSVSYLDIWDRACNKWVGQSKKFNKGQIRYFPICNKDGKGSIKIKYSRNRDGWIGYESISNNELVRF